LAHRPVEHLVEADGEVALDVGAPAGVRPSSRPRFLERLETARAPGPEELLEEIAEAGAAELELRVVAAGGAPRTSPSAGPGWIPTRRGLETGALLPVRAERVVFLAVPS
jgi:hypothetical protein